MAKRSLILTTTSQGGKKLQKTITDVNPNADSEVMLAFVQKLNELTTNTYERTDCVEKYNIDTEAAPSKIEPTLTINNSEPGINFDWLQTSTNHTDYRRAAITYNGDGELYAYTDMKDIVVGITNNHNGVSGTFLGVKFSWADSAYKPTYPSGKKIYLVATEGENYAAKTVELALD